MTSYIPPKKNTAFVFWVSLPSQANTKIMQVNPTLAAGDVTVTIDGGTASNLATLPTVTPASGKRVKVSLSAAEMNGDNITVVFSDAAGSEWCDLTINIQTSANQIDDLALAATALSTATWTNAKAAFLDVATSSRSSHTAADVWTSATRTLTSFGTLIADIWANATRTLSAFDWSIITNRTAVVDLTNTRIKNIIDTISVSLSGADLATIIAGVSTEVDRILTAVATAVARIAGVNRASSISVVQGDTLAESLTITPFVWATGDTLIVTLKDVLHYKTSKSDAADAILQWRFTSGGTNVLTYIKKAAAGASASKGTLSVTDDENGVIVINLDEDISLLIQGEFKFDVKHLVSATDAVNTLGGGDWVFEPTITYSVS